MGQEARPILHIGFHKTATSWFQAHVYPEATSHHYVDRVLVRQTLLTVSAFDFDAAAARSALGFDGAIPPVICDEDLSGFLHLGRTSSYVAKEIACRLHATAPEAQVVIVVRAQPAIICSSYQQYLREGGTASLWNYLFPEHARHPGKARPFKLPGFAFAQFEYHGLIAHYDELFGRENVHVVLYEDFARDRAGTLARMGVTLGLRLGEDRPTRAGAVNASYRRGLMPMVRAANLLTRRSVANKRTLLHIPYWYPARKWLFERLNRLALFGARPSADRMLGPRLYSWIRERFSASNHRLAERLGRDLESLGYPVVPPSVPVGRPSPARHLAWLRN
jgi:hypothetical protein